MFAYINLEPWSKPQSKPRHDRTLARNAIIYIHLGARVKAASFFQHSIGTQLQLLALDHVIRTFWPNMQDESKVLPGYLYQPYLSQHARCINADETPSS